MDFTALSYEQLKAAKLEIEDLMQKRRDDALEAFKKTAAAMDIMDEMPRRHRRTKAQIEADNAAGAP